MSSRSLLETYQDVDGELKEELDKHRSEEIGRLGHCILIGAVAKVERKAMCPKEGIGQAGRADADDLDMHRHDGADAACCEKE